MGTATATRRRRTRASSDRGPHTLARNIVEAFREHDLLTYAAAVAFQTMVALVPLSLLSLALLGRLGLGDVWKDSIAPTLESRLSKPVFEAIDHSATGVVAAPHGGLIALAIGLSLWYASRAIRAVMGALNRIHDVEDERSLWRRTLVALGLATLVSACVVSAALVLAAAPRTSGVAHVVFGLGRWLVVTAALVALVGVIVRVAPAEHPQARWASAGSILVVLGWLVATLLFRLWTDYVADFKTTTGGLTALLVLTGYLFALATIFLVGVQLDELLREETRGRARSVLDIIRNTRS
jgi:membrane protein